MCGITGIVAFNSEGEKHFQGLENAVATLNKRGPDNQGVFRKKRIGLGHARLSIIDTSSAGSQPFTDQTGRYTIVYNGEFYNYKEHRKKLSEAGVSFTSTTDTEVLLNMYIQEGPACLEKINGFFAFAIYDQKEDSVFIARDRMGIKPLLVYQDKDKLIFGSEMKSLLAFGIQKDLDQVSLFTYLQLNYIPAPNTIFENVKKVIPGTHLTIHENSVATNTYYSIPNDWDKGEPMNLSNYEKAKSTLHDLMHDSVSSRLVSDVPLGTFLSGGIDSSIITTIAAKYVDNLHTFSIGYKDEPFFDETQYAELVAKKAGTNHTVFKLTNDDLLDNLNNVLDYLDEPFGDSSAIAVSILSKLTQQHISVALSGDGADEMFSGYNKHMAEFKVRDPGIIEQVVKGMHPLLEKLPQSRDNKITNLTRQMNRYAQGAKMNHKQRYWRWASFLNEEEANYLLLETPQEREQRLSDEGYQYKKRKDSLLKSITKSGGLNDVLYTDMHMVLQNDMLTKVDMMSMSHSLEVRTPFLDHNVVNFAFQLPTEYKINSQMRKKILIEAFQDYLPIDLLNRPKHGFEVPLLKWFRNELKPLITDDLLQEDFIVDQEIFNPKSINSLLKKLFSNNPGDSHATVWALIVFQHWWKKHMSS